MRLGSSPLRCVGLAALLALPASTSAWAEPYRLRADAFAEAPDASGFVALSSEAHVREEDYRYDAEALVWTGARVDAEGDAAARGEAVIASVRVTHPQRLADVTFGRQLYQGGAVRPMLFDGGKAALRSPEGGEIEVFGGLPVQPGYRGRSFDWLGGYRFTHRAEGLGRVGFSYWQERDLGRRAREELGVEATLLGGDILALTSTAALDVLRAGLAEARLSATLHDEIDRLELFAVRRSPSRMLPATSLFAAIGSFDSDAVGLTGSWRAAPRLDLVASATIDEVAESFGATELVRAELRLDDEGRAAIGLEGRRVSMPGTSWTGARVFGRMPIAGSLSGGAEAELVALDDPVDRGALWPWGLLSLRWVPSRSIEAAAGVEASASPEHTSSVGGLLRLSGQWGTP